MVDEEPSVIATGVFAVVADQEVKDSMVVGALGEAVVGLLELLPPPQAAKKNAAADMGKYFIINLIWVKVTACPQNYLPSYQFRRRIAKMFHQVH